MDGNFLSRYRNKISEIKHDYVELTDYIVKCFFAEFVLQHYAKLYPKPNQWQAQQCIATQCEIKLPQH